MNPQRFAVAVTVVNALLLALVVVVLQARPIVGGQVPVVRTSALEIVDQQGRVRASISVMPRDPNVSYQGRVYPETVLLRLTDPVGGPDVKLSVNEWGGILFLGGGADASYVQLGADLTSGWVKLVTSDLREKELRP